MVKQKEWGSGGCSGCTSVSAPCFSRCSCVEIAPFSKGRLWNGRMIFSPAVLVIVACKVFILEGGINA